MRTPCHALLLSAALLAGGCEMQPRPIVSRRYLEADFTKANLAGEHASVSAFAIDVPPPTAAPPSSTPPASTPPAGTPPATTPPADPKKAAEVAAAEQTPVTSPPSAPTAFFAAPIDRTLVKRRLVFSVFKTEMVQSPAARLDLLSVSVDILPTQTPSVSFESWSRLENEHDVVDLGKLTHKQTRQFVGDVTAGPTTGGSVPLTAKATYTAYNELYEELSFKQRYVKFAGALTASSARIYQEGALGIDLVGTSLVDVHLRVQADDAVTEDVYKFHPLYKDGKPLPPADARYSLARLTVPGPRSTRPEYRGGLRARVGGTYRLRLVNEGASTLMEGDDRAGYVRGTLSGSPGGTSDNEFVLLSARDLDRLGHAYEVRDLQGRVLHLDGSVAEHLLFEDRDDAEAWLQWLRSAVADDQPIRVGAHALVLGDKVDVPVKRADLALLQVQLRERN